MKQSFSLFALFSLFLSACTPPADKTGVTPAESSAAVVYYGGDIITMEGDKPVYAEAVVAQGDKIVFVGGGPRVTHQMALECGFDAGFGTGTKPSEVASYIVEELIKRKGPRKKK